MGAVKRFLMLFVLCNSLIKKKISDNRIHRSCMLMEDKNLLCNVKFPVSMLHDLSVPSSLCGKMFLNSLLGKP